MALPRSCDYIALANQSASVQQHISGLVAGEGYWLMMYIGKKVASAGRLPDATCHACMPSDKTIMTIITK